MVPAVRFVVVIMRTIQWVLQLQRTAHAAGFRGFVLDETADEYAESLADFIARAEVNAVFG